MLGWGWLGMTVITMEVNERQRLRRLANDSIIETFGTNCSEQRLAEALESTVEELGFIAEECQHCKLCPAHGDHSDEMLPVDADGVLEVHGELKKQLQVLKDYHVRLVGQLALAQLADKLGDDLGEIIVDIESEVNELERCVIP